MCLSLNTEVITAHPYIHIATHHYSCDGDTVVMYNNV